MPSIYHFYFRFVPTRHNSPYTPLFPLHTNFPKFPQPSTASLVQRHGLATQLRIAHSRSSRVFSPPRIHDLLVRARCNRLGRRQPAGAAGPVLVPLTSLGRRAVATEGSGAQAGSFAIGAADRAAGGPRLRATCVPERGALRGAWRCRRCRRTR
jgi:hypothetical protein